MPQIERRNRETCVLESKAAAEGARTDSIASFMVIKFDVSS